MATIEQVQKVVKGFGRFEIVPPLSGSKEWFLVDTSRAEPEVNWPGDLVSRHTSYDDAMFAYVEIILKEAGL